MNAYFCSTYYHVLITYLKALCSEDKIDVFLLDYIENANVLAERFRTDNIFNYINVLEAPEFVYHKNIIEKLFANKIYKKRFKDFNLDVNTYDSMYLYMDDTWLARYFKLENIKYNLIEDSLDAFKYIMNNRYKELVRPEYHHLYTLYKFFPYAEGNHKHFLDSPSVLSIEVNDRNGIVLQNDSRIVELPRTVLFNQLKNPTTAKKIIDIFLNNNDILTENNIVIVFTSPFCVDGLVQTEKDQIQLYRKLIKHYENNIVYIKTHPRDRTDYTVINNVKVMPKNFPSELISYLDQSRISKFISIASHCVDIYPQDKVDFYELEEVKKWK